MFAAVWYRASAVLANNFMMIAETALGTFFNRSLGGAGSPVVHSSFAER
jgi:hypothetical protein